MEMELNTLRNNPGAKKKRKRVGRGPGSGTGKTSGRGVKGQKSRSGYSRRHGFEGGQMPLHRRLPKRGFNHADRFAVSIVNVGMLERHFKDGDEITHETLIKAGLADNGKVGIKILGSGELTKKLTIKAAAVSEGARQKIEKAGGAIELLLPEIDKKPRKKSKAQSAEAK